MEERQELSKIFTILTWDEQFKWVLPENMAIYADSHFNQYIQEQDLKESILTKNSIPSYITDVKKIGEIHVPSSERKQLNI